MESTSAVDQCRRPSVHVDPPTRIATAGRPLSPTCAGCAAARCTCPATRGTTRPAAPGTCGPTTARPRSPTRRSPTRSPNWSARPRPPACGSPRRAPGTGRRRCPGSSADAVLLRTSAMTELRIDAAQPDRPGGRRGAVGRRDRPRRRRPAGLPAHVQPERRRGRVVPRRRPELVRPRPWPAVQRGHRRRGRARRRHDRPRDGRPGQRPAVGGPRRRRRLRRGHRPGIRPDPGRRPVRRHAGLGVGAGSAGDRRLGRLGRRRARRGDQPCCGWSGPPTCRGCRTAVRGRTVVVDRRGDRRDPSGRRRDHRAAAGAASRRSTPSTSRRPPRWPGCTWSRRSRLPRTPAAPCWPGCRTTPSRRWWRRPARIRAPSCCSPRSASSAARCRARHRGAARWTGSTARSWCSRSAPARRPGGWAAQRADAERVLDAVQPWGTGALYLSMIDDRVDERRAVPAANWDRLAAVRVRRRPRWPLRGPAQRLSLAPTRFSAGSGGFGRFGRARRGTGSDGGRWRRHGSRRGSPRRWSARVRMAEGGARRRGRPVGGEGGGRRRRWFADQTRVRAPVLPGSARVAPRSRWATAVR